MHCTHYKQFCHVHLVLNVSCASKSDVHILGYVMLSLLKPRVVEF